MHIICLKRLLLFVVTIGMFFCVTSLVDAEDWIGGNYPDFCEAFGLGEVRGSGYLVFEHKIGSNVFHVKVTDEIVIIGIFLIEGDRSIPISSSEFSKLIIKESSAELKTREDILDELRKTLGMSHLPFQRKFGSGKLFSLEPRRYYHAFKEVKFIVQVDRNERIKDIVYADERAKSWLPIREDRK